jgi:hypothetical protein
VKHMKSIYLLISIAIMFLIHGSFAQLVSTTDIPSQSMFRAGYFGSTPSTITPSQMTFGGGNNMAPQISSPVQIGGSAPTQMHNISIANALKEGDALHVLVANNGINAIDLANWKLVTDNQNLAFTFPVFTLMPRAMVTIHTHKGNNTMSDLYGSNFMWNGTSEIKLLDNNGMLIYDYRIGAGPSRRTIPINYPLREFI